jgi:tetratricopeptide (TPR) repeat protein
MRVRPRQDRCTVTSERIQRRIDSLLDEADDAVAKLDWATVRDRASAVLAADPENDDGKAYLDMAERGLASAEPLPSSASSSDSPSTTETAQPISFANGRYSVTRFLGEGGKKKVYLAHDAQLDRDVAFALIKTEGLDEAARQRITREAQAMGRLGSHPHIVTVYDIGEENGQPYLVLPVLPGGDVEGVIEDAPDHKLSIEQAVKIATETCLGLEFSHAKGIIHRDLKPGNVWLAEDGRAMIGDFGLAVAVDRSRLTQAGMMVGTVSYMPPEQAMGGEVTPQSDLYSLGAMLYEMVCGRPPFVGDESVAIIGQHLNTPPVAPTWHRPECPPGLEALILRLLEKDPARRPGSATEVREALQSFSSSSASEPSVTQPVEPRGVDPLYRRVFVGREAELRQLQQAYDAAISGQGGLVMVVGEPGIGKTAICEQLATYVSIRGGRWLVGHCYEEGSLSLPYLAFVEAMRTYVLDRDPEALRSELGSGAGEVARIVSEVRDKVDVELNDASDPEDDRWRLLTSITTFLRNAASVQPLVIVLEDLHWADRGTLDLLLHVARNLEGARLLIVGTYRDVEVDRSHPLSATLADLRRINTFLRIPLRGLTVDEVHRMYETLRGYAVPWSQAELVHRQTEGNPLFVQEVLRYLVEEGIIVREAGTYAVRGDATAIPEGLRDVVGRRLGHLNESTSQVLSTASVIGRDFRLDVLRHVVSLEEDEVLKALEEATERSIIEQRQSVGTLAFRFTHAFFRQVLYEEIFAARQIRSHQQVARALEQVYAGRASEHAAELAEHYSHSTDADDLFKAVEFGQVAASRAMSVFAYGEAVSHLEQAVEAQEVLNPEDHERLCDLYTLLGDALIPSGEPKRAMDYAAYGAFRHAEESGDSVRAFEACRVALEAGVIATNLTSGLHPAWFEWIERAEKYAGINDEAELRFNESKAATLAATGRANEATALIEASLTRARQAGLTDVEYGLAANLTVLYEWHVGAQANALTLADEYRTRTAEVVNPLVLLRGLTVAAVVYLENGERAKLARVIEEVASLYERTKTARTAAFLANAQAMNAFFDGRLDDALVENERTGEAYKAAGGAGDSYRQYPGIKFQIEILRNPPEGIESPQGTSAAAIARRALRLAKLGESEEALDLVLTVVGSTLHILGSVPQGHSIALQAVVEIGERELSSQLVTTLLPQSSLVFTHGVVARHIADALVFLDRASEARNHYRQALTVADKMGFRSERALIRAHLAELLLDHYPEEHDAAIEHLDFAIAEFRDMKMQPALERALGRRGLLKA